LAAGPLPPRCDEQAAIADMPKTHVINCLCDIYQLRGHSVRTASTLHLN